MESKTKSILRFFTLAAIIGFVTFLIPQSIGLGASGFDETLVLQQFSFYLVGIGFLVALICLFIVEKVIKKGDARYGDSLAFSSPGETPSIPFFKRFGIFQLFLLSSIIFGVLGFFSFFFGGQTTFTGVGSLEQQFTPAAQLFYSIFLIPGAENLGLALVIGLTIFGIRQFARKTNMTKENFRVFTIFIPLMTGTFYWYVNHLLRYSGQDIAILKVVFFGFVQSLLILLTGTFVVGWALHSVNNLFVDLQRLFTSDTATIYSILVLGILAVIYFIIYRKKLFGRKKQIEGD